MANQWIGLVVSGQYHHGDKKSAIREIGQIFGEDLLASETVCAPSLMETGEYYVFIRCNNYFEHTEAIGNSLAILKVIPSIGSPYLFSDSEVKEFSGSVDKPKRDIELEAGDMVSVNEGYLKGLYGIILDRLKNGKYVVLLSFYTRKFKENITAKDLEFIAKVSTKPKPSGKKKRLPLVNSHKVRRAGRRKHKGSKGAV